MSGSTRTTRGTTGKRPALKPAGGRVVRAAARPLDDLKLGRRNWIFFGIALGVIVVGYILLAAGDITLAPILLVAGYCVLVPYAIVTRDRAPKSSSS